MASCFEGSRLTIADGALATCLEQGGWDLSTYRSWSGFVVLNKPEDLRALHRRYLEAGADVIQSATYQARPELLRLDDPSLSPAEADEIFQRGIQLAVEERDRHLRQTGERKRVAVALGAYAVMLRSGAEYRGDYAVTTQVLEEFYTSVITKTKWDQNGADLHGSRRCPFIAKLSSSWI